MRKGVLVVAILMFGLGFAVGKGWLPTGGDDGPKDVVQTPTNHAAKGEPSYSHLKFGRSEFGSAEGSIILRNNADVPLTVMATITLYDGDQTVATLFARADRVKPRTEQKVGLIGQYKPYSEVAVDLAGLP